MNRRFIKTAIQTIISLLLLLLVNSFFTMTFTGYFCICALALLWSVKIKYSGQFTAWCIVLISSIIVTLNYLRPNTDEGAANYNNAAHNVLVLRGIESSTPSLYLVNSEKRDVALFDSEGYLGKLSAKAKGKSVELSCNILSHPVYSRQNGKYTMINEKLLPSFSKSITFKKASGKSLTLTIDESRKSTQYIVSTTNNEKTLVDTASFTRRIKEGYSLDGILSKCSKDNELKEEFSAGLKGMLLLRKNAGSDDPVSESNPLYISISQYFLDDGISIICDGKPIKVSSENPSIQHTVENNQNIYIGIGSSKTRPIRLLSKGESVHAIYDMPYMYNFPTDSTIVSSHTLAISSNAEDLLSSDVKAAFYYDVLKSPSNKNHFSGSINYQTSFSPNKLESNFTDNKRKNSDVEKDSIGYHLSTDNKTKWIVDVVDLRQNDPLTGDSFWFSDWFILGLIIALSLFAIFFYSLFRYDDEIHYSKANGVLNIWMFFTSLLTLRLYLMWRIAVFPPVESISKGEFNLYRLSNAFGDNSMTWTAGAIAIMILTTIALYLWEKKSTRKVDENWICKRYTSKVFWITLCCAVGLTLVNFLFNLPTFLKVLISVVMPVLLFFFNEWRCVKGLSITHRVVSAITILGLLVVGDAGYAIMFVIFECVYFMILTIVYRKSNAINEKVVRTAIWRSCIVLFILVFLVAIFAPQIVCFLYDARPILGLEILKVSHISFAVVGILIAVAVSYVIRDILSEKYKKYFKIGAGVLVLFLTIGGPIFFNYMGHFKYRSMIHTQDVGQIMEYEDVSTRDSERLLEASQNQWFLQYHNDLGKERILEDGIMHLYPHFKKGVSWNTQISDVICSRYIVGELSILVPLGLILLCFVLLYSVFKHENESSTGYAFSVGVSLLILIQMIFVWMANTNRMIFFGQDLPFLSHNAHSTMLMFALLLAFIMFALGNNGEDEDICLSPGFKHFSGRPFKLLCVLFVAIFGFVFFFGNKYDKLYGGKAKEFSVGQAMDVAESDFVKINNLLSKYKAEQELVHGDNLKKEIWRSIEEKIDLSKEVETLHKNKEISDFSYSLYKAFVNNYAKSNKLENVVHLRYLKSSGSYELALNNGFYCLKAPEMEKQNWTGDIYAYQNEETEIKVQNPNQGNFIYVYSIPNTWLKDQKKDYAIFSNRNLKGSLESATLFEKNGRFNVDMASIYLEESDVVRCKIKNNVYSYQVSGMKEDLLAKNMYVNGSLKFFYPLGEKFYWIKYFADYESNNTNLSGENDCFLTMDRTLTTEVQNILKSYPKVQGSVVAMDGLGNVRLMVDDNEHPNPNNASEIEKFVEDSYLNPNSAKDSRIFGNSNLVHMMPGPGSSMKPITYAAVTSQTSKIDWATLKLKKPNTPPQRVKNGKNSKYHVMHFGAYDYSNRPFLGIPKDEYGEDGWVNNMFYLYQSSNYYNALITYLGYFNYSDFKDMNKIFKPVSDPAKDYPIIQHNGQTYTLNTPPDKDKHQCILSVGLNQNFGMSVSSDNKSDVQTIISGNYLSPNVRASSYPWLFPQVSSVFTADSKGLTAAERLRQYTLGASPLKVTPIMMAEMYGRLFSMHPDYHASVIESKAPFDKKWSNPEMFSFYQKNLFGAMHQCTTDGTAARYLKTVERGGYYLYGKTGTLDDDNNREDKLLAVVITNKDVTTVGSPEDYNFTVVYFRFKPVGDKLDNEEIQEIIGKTLNKIIQSKSFQNYM